MTRLPESKKSSRKEGRDTILQSRKNELETYSKIAPKKVVTKGVCPPVSYDITSLPYTITCPGVYHLVSDLVFTFPASIDPVTAISIESSDVVLDLNGWTLSQGDTNVNGVGIHVGTLFDSFSNITIKNGTVRNFSRTGILLISVGEYSDIHFEDLDVLSNGTNGAYYSIVQGLGIIGNGPDGSGNFPFKNFTLTRVHSNDNFNGQCAIEAASCWIDSVQNLVIRDSTFNNQNSFGSKGLVVLVSNDVVISDTQINGTRDRYLTPCNSITRGLLIQLVSGLVLRNLQVNDTFSGCCSITGIRIDECSTVELENIQIKGVNAGPYLSLVAGGFIVGINITETTPVKINNVQVSQIGIEVSEIPQFQTHVNVFGIITYYAKNFLIENSQVSDINVDIPNAFIAGIFINPDESGNDNSYTVKNCKVSNLSGRKIVLGIANSAQKFRIPDEVIFPKNIEFIDNIVDNIKSTSVDDRVAGIADCIYNSTQDDYATILFTPLATENMFVKGNRVSQVYADPENKLAAGILFELSKSPVVENNVVSDCQRGILLTGTDEVELFKQTPLNDQLFRNPQFTIPFVGIGNNLWEIGWQVDPASWPQSNIEPNYPLVPITNDQYFTNLTRGGTVTITPDNFHQGMWTDFANIATWQTGDVIEYTSGGKQIQLMDGYNCRNAVGNASNASYNGNTRVDAGTGPTDQVFANNMVGGTITFTGPLGLTTATITGFNVTQFDTFSVTRLIINPASWTNGNPGVLVEQPYTLKYKESEIANQIFYFRRQPRNTVPPGFTEGGFIRENEVNKNLKVGIEDRKSPCTTSAFLSNVAFCNGEEGKCNYKIKWGGVPNVVCGSLQNYPRRKYYDQNVSISCKKCDPKCHCHKRR